MGAIIDLMGGHIRSITLSGGFGRGEGGVIVTEDCVRVINDFDIDVIVKGNYLWVYRKYYKRLQSLAERLAQRLKVKQIDIYLKNIGFFFRNAPLTVLNYELLNGHKVLYGDADLAKWMPSYNRKDIPLIEGTTYFLNRGNGLLIAARYFSDNQSIAQHNKENFVIECQKALMAIGDSILILKKEYHYSYVRRINIIQKLDLSDVPYSEEIVPRYIEAMEHKIRPHFEKYYQRNLIDWWFEIQKLYGEFFLFYESQRLDTVIKSWLDYSQMILAQSRLNWNLFFKKLLLKSLGEGGFAAFIQPQIWRELRKSDRCLRLSIMPLLLFSLGKNGVNSEMIERAAILFQKKGTRDSKQTWDELVSCYLDLLHPTGAITKLLRERKNNE